MAYVGTIGAASFPIPPMPPDGRSVERSPGLTAGASRLYRASRRVVHRCPADHESAADLRKTWPGCSDAHSLKRVNHRTAEIFAALGKASKSDPAARQSSQN